MRIRVIRSLILIVPFLLLGCAVGVPFEGDLPGYLVMLTRYTPDVQARCTGVALSESLILTVNHCATLTTVTTQTAQEARITVKYQLPSADLAIMEANKPLDISDSEFASFGERIEDEPAILFGLCPRYFANTARVVTFARMGISCPLGMPQCFNVSEWWAPVGYYICGGDSGGILLQGGKIVGIPHAILSAFWIPTGKAVYAIDSSIIVRWLSRLEGKQGRPDYFYR